MRHPLSAVLLGLLLTTLSGPGAHAGSNADAKVVLHLASTTTIKVCTRPEAGPACTDVVTEGGLYPTLHFAYVLVADADPVTGVAGVAFGINYGSGQSDGVGVDIYIWVLCATLELAHHTPPWPQSGSSTAVTWDNATRCQRNEPGGPGTGVVATVGYFYVGAYSSSSLSAGPYLRPTSSYFNQVVVTDCSPANSIIYDGDAPPDPLPLGSVRFSENAVESGYNPCAAAVPVQSTTWSGIKTQMD